MVDYVFLQVKKNLRLKMQCPVILLKNLSKKLVNGLRGIVVKLEEDGPTINFGTRGLESIKIRRTSFSVYDPAEKRILAERTQVLLLNLYL